ncbi:MAG: hypothetical protein IKM65_08450 [Bacteroidaceae bacterium]|nr:hypothetical protein [Bacteroidaceae bacterium]
MSRLSLILCASLLLVSACSSDDEPSLGKRPRLLGATIEDIAEPSRTTLSDDGVSVYWDANDSLSVFLGGNIMNCAIVYGLPDGRNAKFMVEGSFIIGGTVDDEGTEYTNVALYPYYEDAALVAPDTVATLFPAWQKAVPNSIPDGSPMVAAVGNVTTTSFAFKNVCSFIRFALTAPSDTKITRIVLSSPDKIVSGNMLIKVGADIPPVVLMDEAGEHSVTLDCGTTSIGSEPLYLFMALPPVAFGEDGWSVQLFDDAGSSMTLTPPAFTFERNHFYTMNVDYVPN